MTTFTTDSPALKSGKSLKTLVQRGLKLQERIDELAKKKTDVERELGALIATFDGRDQTEAIELTLGDDVPGRVTFKWGTSYEVDPTKAEKVRKRLGDAEFNRVFSVRKTYSRARSFSTWLKEAHGSKLDRLKSVVEAAVTPVVKKNPTIKWLYDKQNNASKNC